MKKLLFMLTFAFTVISVNALVYTVTVPTGTNTCYIAGEMNGWTHQLMTKVDAENYTIEIPTATTEQKYKYCSGPRWGYVEEDLQGNDIANRSYSTKDLVLNWSVFYDQKVPDENLVYNVTVPAGTKNCYIVGGWDGWSSFEKMDKVDPTHFTITILSNIQLKYLYSSGLDWEKIELTADGSYGPKRSYSTNDVVLKWSSILNTQNIK